ncbi:hypothetical protein BO78DRAFT_455360 [Aspergillus sclerotiicarbonarius CBS 121057]|uniref:Uncharacterized protein n=1 Tax=Aspergillus sclerotiicarbonarius (strain CBS 121057 / IBT 28362) TaxID=1448318 RepID=A0A319E5R4_ASPSB|nr:hypothetical protein BO78DRAFT_455360 [Aspergillus sclerotiicarbonarius CBS 121057]
MSLPDLETNGLYVVLHIRNDPPLPNDFHWGFYLHKHPKEGGVKYHVREEGSNGWIADHGPTAGVMKSVLLVGLFRIADVPVEYEGLLDETMRSYDGILNSTPGIRCSAWVRWTLALLQKGAGGTRILKCDDLEALVAEIKAWGNSHAMNAALNIQPRPLAVSTLCGL